MAANMPQMAMNSQMMANTQQQQQQQRQLQSLVYGALINNSASTGVGWQSAVPINDRLSKTMNLYGSVRFVHDICYYLANTFDTQGHERNACHASGRMEECCGIRHTTREGVPAQLSR